MFPTFSPYCFYLHSNIQCTRDGRKISGLFVLLSFFERKLHFIAYRSAILFSKRSVCTRSFQHLNKVGVRATIDSRLEE